MANEIIELRKLLATTVEYVEMLYGQMTDQLIENRALREAGKASSPEFEVRYKECLGDQSSADIRNTRPFGYPKISEVSRSLKQ
jgi:hypothetical protein